MGILLVRQTADKKLKVGLGHPPQITNFQGLGWLDFFKKRQGLSRRLRFLIEIAGCSSSRHSAAASKSSAASNPANLTRNASTLAYRQGMAKLTSSCKISSRSSAALSAGAAFDYFSPGASSSACSSSSYSRSASTSSSTGPSSGGAFKRRT